jgi:hypothetical protein
MRAWCVREFTEQGLDFLPVRANLRYSVQKGTVRGIQLPIGARARSQTRPLH